MKNEKKVNYDLESKMKDLWFNRISEKRFKGYFLFICFCTLL